MASDSGPTPSASYISLSACLFGAGDGGLVNPIFLAEDETIQNLLKSIEAPLKQALEKLGDQIGTPPPMVVQWEDRGIFPAVFDERCRLCLHPALLGEDFEVEEAKLQADSAQGAMTRHERLFLTLLEAAARFAMTVRFGLQPERFSQLESQQAWFWSGLGVFIARRCVPYMGPEPIYWRALLEPETGGLQAWARGGSLFWIEVSDRLGLAKTLNLAQGLLQGSVEQVSGPGAAGWLAQNLQAFGEVWNRIGQKLVSFMPTTAFRLPLLSANGSVDLGGLAEAFSFTLLRLEVGGPGNPALLSGKGIEASVRRGDGWLKCEQSIPGGGVLLMTFLQPGEWSVKRSPSTLLGAWSVKGASYGSQIFGVRGMVFDLTADGRFELQMQDAFAGPASAEGVQQALRIGFSGSGSGCWRLEGQTLSFAEMQAENIKMHAKDMPIPMSLPMGNAEGSANFLAGVIQSIPWLMTLDTDKLRLTGSMNGAHCEIRLERDLSALDHGFA